MEENKHHIYGGERDIPIDLARVDGEGTQFARFYLERANQNSNIYFVEHHEEARAHAAAPRWRDEHIAPRVSPMSIIWRLAWLCAAGGATAALAVFVVAPRIIPAGEQASARTYTDMYARVLAAQQALFALHIDDAIAGFPVSSAHGTAAPGASSGVAAAITAVRTLFSKTAAPSTLDAVLNDVAVRSAASAAPLADLSFASFFHTDAGITAGNIVDRAFNEVKNAEAAVDNAQQALFAAQEGGDGNAAALTLGPQLSVIKENLERYAADLTFASWALGTEYTRHFLIVAQDPTMARATGGIIRSLGVITVQKGAITDVAFDEIYNVDGQLSTNVVPPEPIQKVATAWAIHDANWFLDFPTSARTIADLYEKTGEKNIDGVIAVNDRMLKKLLAVTGPVAGKGGVLVNAESGSIAGDPAALSAAMNVVKTLHGEKAGDAFRVITDGLAHNDVLVWLSDRDYENTVNAKGWGGVMAKQDGADYLAVAASDIEGSGIIGMTGELLKETAIDAHGAIVNTVVAEFVNKSGATGKKLRYLRFYVPHGSALLDVSGNAPQKIVPQIDYAQEHFIHNDDLAVSERTMQHDDGNDADVFEESGATVFGVWLPLGEKGGRVVIRYTTPFSFSAAAHGGTLSSVFQKQPGIDMQLHFTVTPPDGISVSSPDGFTGDFNGDFSADRTFTMTIR